MKKIVTALAGIGLTSAWFINRYPVFGKRPSRAERRSFERSDRFVDGKFKNEMDFQLKMEWDSMKSILKDYGRNIPNLRPVKALPTLPYQRRQDDSEAPRVTWFGHSAFLLELDGQTIFFDPMLGRAPSPFPKLGGGRFQTTQTVDLERLPLIDVVVYSHDHYDHLDYPSVLALKNRVGRFIVPLGVGSRLRGWGVSAERITELDWHESTQVGGIKLTAAPSRHYSGRNGLDQFSTLWASWVIEGSQKVFFSGDSGYGPHFKAIGEQYGPFDLTMMECGQYDVRWSNSHMLPEQTVQAHRDVKGRVLMPIHWSAFILAFHAWFEPVERLLKEAKRDEIPVLTPMIGESVTPESTTRKWWREVR